MFAPESSTFGEPTKHRPFAMAAEAHTRALYRAIIRELPVRKPATSKTPLHHSIRKHFTSTPPNASAEYALARRQEAEQFVQYLKAQRTYGFLLERYNPGMGMDEEERVRLSARRVGMNLPVTFKKPDK